MKKTPLQLYNHRIDKELKRHREEIANIERLLRKKQIKCKHDYQFYPDASGNNDSYYKCTLCGLRK